MVDGSRRRELALALVLWSGACAGVAIALIAVLALAVSGEMPRPWLLSLADFAGGDRPWLVHLAVAGLWLLALTPSLMLLGYALVSVRARAWRSLAVCLGLLAISGAGLALALI